MKETHAVPPRTPSSSSADEGAPGGGGSSAGESGVTIRGRRPSHLPGVLDVHVLLAEQGGETAEEEEQRLLGHAGGGDDPQGEAIWKLAVRVSALSLIRFVLQASEESRPLQQVLESTRQCDSWGL